MGFEPLSVTANGKSVRLFRGATVRHALIKAAASSELVKLVQNGGAVVWDETAGAQTDLGGALYDGQVLTVKSLS